MDAYKENNEVGNELLPIKICKVDMNRGIGITVEVISGFGGEFIKRGFSTSETLPHWHTYLEVIYFTEGDAEVQINNRYFNVKKGQILLINSLDIHSIRGNCRHIAVLIDLKAIHNTRMINTSIFPDKCEDKLIGKDFSEDWIKDIISEDIQFILNMYDNKTPGYCFRILSRIYDMLGNIWFYSSKVQPKGEIKSSIKNENLQRLEMIFDYLDKNYREPISLTQICKVLNFSPNYFCRFFKNNMGKSFFEHLNYYRCSKAEILLNTSEKSITEIALEVGFNSVSYFDKTYKKYKGCEPSEERCGHKNE